MSGDITCDGPLRSPSTARPKLLQSSEAQRGRRTSQTRERRPRTTILDFGGLDSSTLLIARAGFLMSIESSLDFLSQQILVGTIHISREIGCSSLQQELPCASSALQSPAPALQIQTRAASQVCTHTGGTSKDLCLFVKYSMRLS